jgi:hypothetical protein
VSWLDKGTIRDVLKNWPLAQESRICVVTDGSRILGALHPYSFLRYVACSLSEAEEVAFFLVLFVIGLGDLGVGGSKYYSFFLEGLFLVGTGFFVVC